MISKNIAPGLSLENDIEFISNIPQELTLKNQSILVVDDAKENTQLFKLLLESYGAQVETLYTGMEVLEKVKRKSYDLLLLDIQMPLKDGFEVLSELRENGFCDLMVCALTAHGSSDDFDQISKAGFNGHIVKLIGKVELARQVIQLLRKKLSS